MFGMQTQVAQSIASVACESAENVVQGPELAPSEAERSSEFQRNFLEFLAAREAAVGLFFPLLVEVNFVMAMLVPFPCELPRLLVRPSAVGR